jgi:tRNA G46 methylase TrmB
MFIVKLKELIKKSPFFYITWRIRTSYQNKKLRKISSELGYDITKDVKALHRRKSKGAMNYAHSSPTIFDCLAISSSDKILDYGSGKGGAMIWLAQRYPFEKVTGIEFCTEYDNVAKQNIAISKLSHLTTYNVDASTFTDIDEYNYFYFFNPFIGETMNRVVANITDSFCGIKEK